MTQSTVIQEYLDVYELALSLFKQEKYDEAWQLLEDFAQQSGAQWLMVELLKAYILREQEKYVSEIAQLKSLLVTYGESADKKRLADAYSLLGGACARLTGCLDFICISWVINVRWISCVRD